MNPQISVVILCYREEEFAPVFAQQMQQTLEARGLSYELILVANYKPEMKGIDRTPEIVAEFARRNPYVVPVILAKEGMMGWDMRSGLQRATGDTVAVIDGDGQMPPEDIVKVYDALMAHHADMAKTYRVHRFDGFDRVFISRVFNLLFRFLFPVCKVQDVNSKPKIFTREALSRMRLTSDGWFIDAEMIIKAGRAGMTITEVPTDFYAHQHRSSLIGVAAIAEFVRNLVWYRVRNRSHE